MSRLKDLVDELCPNGVEYSSIGSLITRVRTRGKDNDDTQQVYVVSNTLGMVKAEDFRENTIHSEDTSNYTVIKPNMYAYNPSRLNIGSIAMLKDNTPGLVSPMYVVFSIDEQKITKEFFEYNIKSSFVRNKIESFKEEGARFRFDFNRWDWIQIAVPPLPVQQEIIRMLDNFTGLTAELTAELTARKKQYEYYRDELLAKEEEVYSLEQVCRIVDCPHSSPKWKTEGIPVIRNFNLVNGNIDMSSMSFVDEEEYKERTKRITPQKDDILFSREAPIGNVGIIPEDLKCCQGQRVVLLRPNPAIVRSRYLLYALQGSMVKKQTNKVEKIGSTVSNFNIADLKQLRISIPTISVQEAIVDKLDVFSLLCSDITTGLPSEIDFRRKQYEYYRNRLLNFQNIGG